MSKRNLGYWALTGLFVFSMAGGGVLDLILADQIKETLTHLGYPLYLGRLLGVLKLLGVLALLAPGLPLLKEWAYAGFFFDLLGAVVSHASVGDGFDKLFPPLCVLALGVGSYLLRPADRRLTASPSLGEPAGEPAKDAPAQDAPEAA